MLPGESYEAFEADNDNSNEFGDLKTQFEGFSFTSEEESGVNPFSSTTEWLSSSPSFMDSQIDLFSASSNPFQTKQNEKPELTFGSQETPFTVSTIAFSPDKETSSYSLSPNKNQAKGRRGRRNKSKRSIEKEATYSRPYAVYDGTDSITLFEIRDNMISACEAGDLATVQKILNENPNYIAEFGESSVNAAYNKDQLEIVEYLLKQPDIFAMHGVPPIYSACRKGDFQVLEMILKLPNIDLTTTNVHNNSPLFTACVSKSVKAVEVLLNDPRINVNSKFTYDGNYPLLFIAENNLVDMMKLVLKHGADVNITASSKRTALHYACSRGLPEIVRLLLEREELNPNVKADEFSEGATPLRFACDNLHLEVVKLLIADDRVDVNITSPFMGETVLHDACSKGNFELVQILLTCPRCDFTITTTNGESLLEGAFKRGEIQVITDLLEDSRCFTMFTEKIVSSCLNYAAKLPPDLFTKIALRLCAASGLSPVESLSVTHPKKADILRGCLSSFRAKSARK